jgi:ferredoxin
MSDMRVVVDRDACESNALCVAFAPDVFELREDDRVYLLQGSLSEERRPKVEEAVRRCPKAALSITEEGTGFYLTRIVAPEPRSNERV